MELSTSQDAMDNRSKEMSEKFEVRNTILTNWLINFQENETQQPRKGSFPQICGKIPVSCKKSVLISKAAFAVIFEDSNDHDRKFEEDSVKFTSKEILSTTVRAGIFLSAKFEIYSSSKPWFFHRRIKMFKKNTLLKPKDGTFIRDLRFSFSRRIPNTCFMHSSQQRCPINGGCPVHLALYYTMRRNRPTGGMQNPINQNSKGYICSTRLKSLSMQQKFSRKGQIHILNFLLLIQQKWLLFLLLRKKTFLMLVLTFTFELNGGFC